MTSILLLVALALQQQPATPAAPETPDRSTQWGSAQATYAAVRGFILKSAEKMPAEHFAFQPTSDVRSFGQVLAHIADANYFLCAPAMGVESPNGTILQKTENAKLGRDAMMQALKDSFAFCDTAYSGLTESNLNDVVTFANGKRPRLATLWFHIAHAFEHYGNLVTYMRLKGIVPPSTERG